MNYLKNKKYYILVSLFYALSTQKVAAVVSSIEYKLKYSWTSQGSSYINSGSKFHQIQEVYNDSKKGIAVFVGENIGLDHRYPLYTIFIAPTAISNESSIKVTGYSVPIRGRGALDENSKAKLKAYSKGLLGKDSFIFSLEKLQLTFYYTTGQIKGYPLKVVTKTNENLYTEKKDSYDTQQYQFILEEGKQDVKKIAETKLIKDSTQARNRNTKGWQSNIPSLNNKYPALTDLRIIVSCIVVLGLAIAAFHKKVISGKKVRDWLSWISRKQK